MEENKEKIELKYKELDEFAGGTTNKSNNANGKLNNTCEPRICNIPLKVDGKPAASKELAMCSDVFFKGSKPECAGCEANK